MIWLATTSGHHSVGTADKGDKAPRREGDIDSEDVQNPKAKLGIRIQIQAVQQCEELAQLCSADTQSGLIRDFYDTR
jgi:hypothetical protein